MKELTQNEIAQVGGGTLTGAAWGFLDGLGTGATIGGKFGGAGGWGAGAIMQGLGCMVGGGVGALAGAAGGLLTSRATISETLAHYRETVGMSAPSSRAFGSNAVVGLQ
ncbi:DUF5862 family protein [Burkholderia cenocepacia]|uniref:DUF5862 family protein n=1 Tax=Burkholderia cenocepacia TaxID=95486 RepID=UPI0038BDD0EF